MTLWAAVDAMEKKKYRYFIRYTSYIYLRIDSHRGGRTKDKYTMHVKCFHTHQGGRKKEEPRIDHRHEQRDGRDHESELHKIQHVDGHLFIKEGHVLGEAIQHTPHWISVDKANGCVYDATESTIVQSLRNLAEGMKSMSTILPHCYRYIHPCS